MDINFNEIRCVKCYSEKTLINYPVVNNNLEINSIIHCNECDSLFPIVDRIPFFLLPELIDSDIYKATKELFNKRSKK